VGGERVAGITTEEYYSGAPQIVERVTRAIISPEGELIEINLGAGDYWWSTRLYLLTALLSDYSKIEYFVFVEGGAERRSSDSHLSRASARPSQQQPHTSRRSTASCRLR
jgi:hypothetical protein